ncbi:probable inactive receptor kinase At5g10020 [Punica granatum]|uniref:Protein kinase domain-containing protein n=2 Tax=Punica granatum TaxID=22663 RepID=A0A218W8G7_PUNGR|nr:probable inactive receptor kinase At5g10020 [Punica granatum]XP_031400815.1 probable inactive receptor kinase At5g10020 [Punica granatum]OWM69085.1 hypothetical protein CDL15_Pgr025272 [Punica granatum]PKI73290.1 hypothetical protein CRG98_006228 [Punica granatum]
MQIICFVVFSLLVVKDSLGQQAEFEALLDLKKGFRVDPSGQILSSWSSNSVSSDRCPENWLGIMCSDGHVISIVLDNVGLTGEFSFSAVSSFAMLQNLSLSNNQLTGNISESAPGFVHLKYLDLHSNGFVGDAMGLISQLGRIEYADLSSNKFSGSMDIDVGDTKFVSMIRYLNLSNNLLAGELFAHDGMPFFDSLEVFDASNNQLTGKLPSFEFVVSLKILRLGNNRLSGPSPQALLQESSMILTELDLSRNQLEGPVGRITSSTLKTLNLSSNRLSGSLPLTIGHCSMIDLSNNTISGNLSRIQGWGNYVEAIDLSLNSLTGTFPTQTSEFLRLTLLKITRNYLEGGLPDILGTYPELKLIDLRLNQLNGPLLPSLFNSTKLTELNLSGNNFSGPVPIEDNYSSSSQELSLSSLDLSNNSLSGSLPQGLGRFQDLEHLDLSINNFDGSIPSDLPGALKRFNVSFNNLSGVVPENLQRFPDSAFHPGNLLLSFPTSPSSPIEGPDLRLRGHGSRLNPATKIGLIAGLIGGFSILALLCFIIYYRKHRWESKTETSEGNIGKLEHPPIKDLSTPSTLVPNKISELPDQSASCQPEPASSAVKSPSDLGPERRDEALSSPIFLPSSLNPSPSRSQYFSETPTPPSVCSPDKLDGDLHLFDVSPPFTAGELSRAPAEVTGRSCHGTLYKARLDSGQVLAVKWLREGIAKGRKDFAREVRKLGSIKHPNLVSLQGYYWGPREHEKLIISSYIDGISLDLYLHETEPKKLPPLSLEARLRISIDVARCLNFLHNEMAIPHGNLKSTNVLLEINPDLNALLTDYSLHRIMTSAGTTEQVLNSGALGYRPPEFASSTRPCPSLKSDVYAFGIILLELLTGRSSGEIVCGDPGVVDLTDWVRLLVAKGRSFECYDPNMVLSGMSGSENLHRILDSMLPVALRCILPASERPDIRTVFEDLSSIAM